MRLTGYLISYNRAAILVESLILIASFNAAIYFCHLTSNTNVFLSIIFDNIIDMSYNFFVFNLTYGKREILISITPSIMAILIIQMYLFILSLKFIICIMNFIAVLLIILAVAIFNDFIDINLFITLLFVFILFVFYSYFVRNNDGILGKFYFSVFISILIYASIFNFYLSDNGRLIVALLIDNYGLLFAINCLFFGYLVGGIIGILSGIISVCLFYVFWQYDMLLFLDRRIYLPIFIMLFVRRSWRS